MSPAGTASGCQVLEMRLVWLEDGGWSQMKDQWREAVKPHEVL